MSAEPLPVLLFSTIESFFLKNLAEGVGIESHLALLSPRVVTSAVSSSDFFNSRRSVALYALRRLTFLNLKHDVDPPSTSPL